METCIRSFRAAEDDKVLFLDCYARMTRNMLGAVEQRAFDDPDWVRRLLTRFADYYFVALDAYEQDPAGAPAVWRRAHDRARDPGTTPLQKLLLGVNAHINYDLVFALLDLLRPEWDRLSAAERSMRYADHCRVNDTIARTIDEVQDEVIEPSMPCMSLVDVLLGPADELMISFLVTRWRETVWTHAVGLLGVADPDEQARRVRAIEAATLDTAGLICR